MSCQCGADCSCQALKKGHTVARVMIDIDAADLRRRLGLTQAQLPDQPTSEQIAAAMAGPSGPSPQPARGEHFSGSVPEGFVLVEQEQWDTIQGERAVVGNRERDELIERALSRGKFPPYRREHFTTLYNADPEGTTRLIVGMADNVVPVEQRGDGRSGDGEIIAGGGDAYPDNWLTGEERHRLANADEHRRVVVGTD